MDTASGLTFVENQEIANHKKGCVMSMKYLVPVLASLAYGCTVTPIKTVEPVTTSGIWKNGVLFVESRQPDSIVLVGYSQYEQDGYAFDAVITNHGSQPVLFEPNRILCKEFNETHEMVRSVNAVDPEERIALVTQRLKNEEEEPTGFALLDLAATTVDLFDGPDTPEERQAKLEEEQAEAAQEARIANLKAEKEKYIKELLRKHQLEPGEVIAGRLICPRLNAKTATLHLEIPIGETSHDIAWRTTARKS